MVLGTPDWQMMRDLTRLETHDLLRRYQSKLHISGLRRSQLTMSARPPAAELCIKTINLVRAVSARGCTMHSRSGLH